jgi:hypothetical protein
MTILIVRMFRVISTGYLFNLKRVINFFNYILYV